MTIKQFLISSLLPTIENEILVSYLLKKDQSFLHAHPEYKFTKTQENTILGLVKRRESGEPIQYLTNVAHFYGLQFYVDKRVLIPRQETEDMVDLALSYIKTSKKDGLVVADIGTGSGNIIVAIAKHLPKNKKVTLLATDISDSALEIAKMNAKKHKVEDRITFLQGNLLEPLHRAMTNGIDLITANLPYVRDHLYGVLDPQITWEPEIAIKGGSDGQKLYSVLFNQLPQYLNKDGLLLYEIDGRIYTKTS